MNAILVRPLALPAIIANDGSAAGTSPAYLDNDMIGVVQRGTALSAGAGAGVDVDFGAAASLDTIAFLSVGSWPANLIASAGTSQGSTSALGSTTIPFVAGSALPDSGRQNSLALLTSAVSARWWRLSFDTLSTPFEAGRLVMGTRFQPTFNFSFGASVGTRDLGAVEFSRGGVGLVTPARRLRTLALSFTRLTKAEAEADIATLLNFLGNTSTVLIVTDPAADAQRSRRMFFGYLTGDLSQAWRVANGWEWRAQLTSLI